MTAFRMSCSDFRNYDRNVSFVPIFSYRSFQTGAYFFMISNTMRRFLVFVAKLRRSKVDEEVFDIR